MQSCPVCLGELARDPASVAHGLAALLAAGAHLFRPDGRPPFAEGPSCTLRRLAGRGRLVFIGADEFVEADVGGRDLRVGLPLACRDPEGLLLFRLRTYEAAEDAVVAIDEDGAPIGTYLRDGDGLEVRDETSAPVAALRKGPGGFDLVETGGVAVARCTPSDLYQDGTVDDQWELRVTGDLPLRPLAAVALVLAAKVFFGRPFPLAPDEDGRRSG